MISVINRFIAYRRLCKAKKTLAANAGRLVPFLRMVKIAWKKHDWCENVTVVPVHKKGLELVFNAEWTFFQDNQQLCWALAVMAVQHTEDMYNRRGNRHPQIWSSACNYIANRDVLSMGILEAMPPEGVLYDEQYEDKTLDEVYDLLLTRYSLGALGSFIIRL